jgi:hypothetical protein
MKKLGHHATIDRVWVPRNVKVASNVVAEEMKIDMEIPEDIVWSDDFVYSTVRAISARTNMNMDGFMKEELLGFTPDWTDSPVPSRGMEPHNDKFGYRTFIGKNNHIDHANQPEIDHGDDFTNAKHNPRGKILWSWFHDDELDDTPKLGSFPDPVTKLAGSDAWVKLLIANDRKKYPILCRAIEDGIVTKVSMGAEVAGSTCSVCGKFAGAPYQYCEHVRFGRGQPFSAESGSEFVQAGVVRERDPILAFENNKALQFFEESWIMDIQADPTAVIMELIKAEPGTSLRSLASTKTSSKRDYRQMMMDLINFEGEIEADEIEKIAHVLNKESADFNVSFNNVPDLMEEKRKETLDEMSDMDEDEGPKREMDYTQTPDKQEGEFLPDYPFPCSARTSAAEANPSYPLDVTIDVEMCMGCMYNKSDKVGAVDCSFPEVVREGGKDPLPEGFEPAEKDDHEGSGLKNDDGTEITEYPGIDHPPTRLSAFYRLKAMLDVGRGSVRLGADLTERDREFYPGNRDEKDVDTYEHRIAISIPSAQQDGEPIDPEGREWLIDSIRKVMSKEFGGTRIKGQEGDFVEGDVHHKDQKTVIEADLDDYDKGKDFITDLAFAVEDAFNQYAIEYFIDDKAFFTRDVH